MRRVARREPRHGVVSAQSERRARDWPPSAIRDTPLRKESGMGDMNLRVFARNLRRSAEIAAEPV